MTEKLSLASRMVPCSVTLITVGTKEKQDAMTGTAMFVSEDLPLLIVSVAKHLLTHELIEETGEFVLNVASPNQAELARKLGATHGRDVDKFKQFNIGTGKANKVQAPVINGSSANLECKVVTSYSTGNYTIYLAEVVDMKVDDTETPMAWYRNKYFALGGEL